MGTIRDAGRSAWSKNPVGAEPDKDDILDFVDKVDEKVTALELSQNGGSLAYETRDDLYANTSAAADVKAEVWADPDDGKNGVYSSDGSGTGADRWTRISGLNVTGIANDVADLQADLAAAEADIASLQSGKASNASVTAVADDVAAIEARAGALEGRSNYVATAITGTPDALVITTGFGIDTLVAGMRVSFRATPGANTSSTVTIDLDSTAPEPVKRGNGSDLRPGDLLGKQWQQTVEWTGNSWRLISSSQAVEVAEAVATRDDDGVVVTDANDVVPFEIEPSGRPVTPAILAENVSGVSAGWLRRQHLSTVSRLPQCVGLPGIGQSNELGNKADGLSTLRSARNMRMLVAGVRAFAGSGTAAENRESLVPHVEAFVAAAGDTPDRGETNRFGTAEAMLDTIELEEGWGDYASRLMTISTSCGQGSTTIAQLLTEENLAIFRLDVEAAAGFADSLFDEVIAIPGVDYNQIEGDVDAETPADEWIDQMVDAQATLEGIVNTARGVATSEATRVPLVIHQAATWNYYGVGHELARAAVTLAQMSDRFILLPSYMKIFPDDVHYTAEDHHGVDGPRIGFIWKRLLINAQARSTFAPSVPIDGAHDVEGKWAWVPLRSWFGDPWTVDTVLVTKVANFGLTALEDDGTTPATIEKVVVQPKGLLVKFSATVGAGTYLDYALDGAGDPGRNSGPRGNLRTTHGEHVQVTTMQGVKPVHEWAPAFRYQLT